MQLWRRLYSSRQKDCGYVGTPLSTTIPNHPINTPKKIAEIRGYVSRQRAEAQTARNNLGQLRAMLAELEAMNDNGETKDPKLCLRADIHEEESRLEELEDVIAAAEDRIQSKEAHVRLMERQEAFVGRVVD
ncbi:hypothetical protein Tco_1282450 [Tanacetum coccineum]